MRNIIQAVALSLLFITMCGCAQGVATDTQTDAITSQTEEATATTTQTTTSSPTTITEATAESTTVVEATTIATTVEATVEATTTTTTEAEAVSSFDYDFYALYDVFGFDSSSPQEIYGTYNKNGYFTCEIYTDYENDPTNSGALYLDYDFSKTSGTLTFDLYFDEENDTYFYISQCAIMLYGEDATVEYFSSGELIKYIVSYSDLTLYRETLYQKTYSSSTVYPYNNDDSIDAATRYELFIKECDNILSHYTYIRTIELSLKVTNELPLVDMTQEQFENIASSNNITYVKNMSDYVKYLDEDVIATIDNSDDKTSKATALQGTIVEILENTIFIDENNSTQADIRITISDSLPIYKNDEHVDFSALEVGQIITVLFDGYILESYPMQLGDEYAVIIE